VKAAGYARDRPAHPGEVDDERHEEVRAHARDRDAIDDRALENQHDDQEEDVAEVLHRTSSFALSPGALACVPGTVLAFSGDGFNAGLAAFCCGGAGAGTLSGATASSAGILGPWPEPSGM